MPTMSMETCFKNICRLCGERRAVEKGRTPHEKTKYALIIKKAFGEDISSDEERVHPPFVCHNCTKKLNVWWSNVKLKKKAALSIDLATFNDVHRCEFCNKVEVAQSFSLEALVQIAHVFGLLTWLVEEKLQVMRLGHHGRPEVYVDIFRDGSWKVSISDVDMVRGSGIFSETPDHFNEGTFRQFLDSLMEHNTCRGNDDFQGLVKAKEGPNGQIPITVTGRDVYQTHPTCTIRHELCSLLVKKPGDRCDVCRMHRTDLRSAFLKQQKMSSVVRRTTRNDRMSYDQLKKKASQLQTEKRSLQQKNRRLLDRVTEMMQKESAPVHPEHDVLLQEMLTECDQEIQSLTKESSPARLLWDQQKEAMKKGKAMRWHPAIIRFCVALQSKSPSAYKLMRESGFFHLPHPTTLHPYSHFGTISSGVNADLLRRITSDHISKDMPAHHRDVSVLFDEMKVKAGLVYSEGIGSIVGFVDVGSIGNEILAFERKCKKDDQVPIATHVLVCMVRGIFTSLHAPIGYYPSTGVTSHQLYSLIWEAVLLLEASGFTVRALVSDGASQNRKFYRLNRDTADTGRDVFCTQSPVDPSRKVYFFADVPHLLKTTRNNWENSGYNSNTRKLHYKSQDIKWTHLLQLYEWDLGYERTAPGLRRLHKIKHDHLHLTPRLRMRVYLAAQVLSTTVANALSLYGRHDTSSTELFIRNIDQFFDCLNVSNLYEGRNKRKPALEPYRTVDDWRFDWLTRDFLGFLADWEEEAHSHHQLDKQVQNQMCLSKETSEGFRITVQSFVELSKLLLGSSDVDFILSAKFNQDPLEMYFSKQRGAGGSSDNPTVPQFGHNMFSLYTASSCLNSSKKGNIRTGNPDEETVIDSTPLPKKPKRK